MARDWVAVLNTWSRPVSDTEAEKAERAEGMVCKALSASTALAAHDVRVFAQGSYRNDTNIRADSDVDIAACCTDVFHADYASVPGLKDSDVGNTSSEYSKRDFRSDVYAALVEYFGAQGITEGNKAIDIHANTYRLDADVVPCVEYRWYERYASGDIGYTRGI